MVHSIFKNWRSQELPLEVVKAQDWRVDRKYPHFINDNTLKELKLPYNANVLHIGFGDGTCTEPIGNLNINARQTGYANAVYCDWFNTYERLSQDYFPDKTSEFHKTLASILRTNLLFDPKLFSIETKKLHYDFSSKYLINFATNNIPKIQTEKLSLSKCGTIINAEKYSNFELTVLDEYRNLDWKFLKALPWKLSVALAEKLTQFNEIYINDFLLLETDFYNAFDNYLDSNNLKKKPVDHNYDLMLSTRADAFLGKKYYSFLEQLLPFLNTDGVYISDGVLSAYSYQFAETEYQHLKENNIWDCKFNLVKQQETNSVEGIIITGRKFNQGLALAPGYYLE